MALRGLARQADTYRRAQWLFPIAVTIHNLEEAIWLPAWVARHSAELPWQVEPGAFRFGVAVLTAAAWIVTMLSVRKGRESVWAYLLFGYIVAMLVNVFVPHIPATLVFRGYTPGVVTAVTVNLPVTIVLWKRALGQGWVSGRKAVLFGFGVPIALVALAPVLLAAGKAVSHAMARTLVCASTVV